jgi:hypothetical protein
MKPLDQARLRHADDDRLRTGNADRALHLLLGVGCPPLEIPDRGLDAFGERQQRGAVFGEAIAARGPRHQRLPDPAFELFEPAMHGRLAGAERLAGGNRAAMARNREEILQIVPVEHAAIMHFWSGL